jgi:hypothetical protein
MRNYDGLRDAFQVLAAGVKAGVKAGAEKSGARPPKPSQREIAGVLGALERISSAPSHEHLCEEMAKDGWDEDAAQKARYRVVGARFAEHVVVPTAQGREWLDSARESGAKG